MANDSDVVIQATFKYTEEGADAVIAANQAVEQSTADMSKGAEAATSGLSEVGAASAKAGDEVGASVSSYSAIEESFMSVKQSSGQAEEGLVGAGKGAEEAGGGFSLLGGSSMMAAMMIMQMAQMVGQAVMALDKMDEAALATAGAFGQLMNDGQKAQQELSTLSSTWAAAKFGTQAIDNVAQHLLMAGENADQANKEITRVADAVAAMGGSAQQIEPVIDKLHAMQKEGAITDQDMQDLAHDGIAGYDALAAGLTAVRGHLVTVDEAQKEVNSGAISGQQAYNDMMEGMMKYSGAAKEQSSELSSQWQQFGQEASQAFGPLIDDLTKFLKEINDVIQAVQELRSDLGSLGGGAGGGVMSTMDTVLGLYTNPAYTLMGFLPGHTEGIIDSPEGHYATVGERGPETMFIPQGASIFPNGVSPFGGGSGSSISSMMSGGGDSGGSGGQPIIIVAQLHVDGRQMAQTTIPYVAPMVRALIGGKQ